MASRQEIEFGDAKLPVGIATINTKSQTVVCTNSRLAAMLGTTVAALTDSAIEDLLPNFDAAQFEVRTAAIQRAKELSFERELRFGSRTIHALLTVTPLSGDELLLAIQDISSQFSQRNEIIKLANDVSAYQGAALFEEVASRLASILGMDALAIVEHRDGGRYGLTRAWSVDSRLEKNYEYKLLGTPCDSLVQGSESIWPTGIQAVFPQDTDLIELRAQAYVGMSLRESAGDNIGHIACIHREPIIEDTKILDGLRMVAPIVAGELVRERMRSEIDGYRAKVEQVQRLESLGVLAGGIAHDFNNLLTSVIGNVELAGARSSNAPEYQKHLDGAIESAWSAADLCKQLLAYSGRGEYSPQKSHVGILIKQVERLVEASVSKQAVMTLEIEASLPPVFVDRSQFTQLMMNLVINASDAMRGLSGRISIRTRLEFYDGSAQTESMFGSPRTGQYVVVEVADEGAGMDAITRSRMFEPFFTTKEAGRGLGLSTSLGIIRTNNGGLSVSSELGKGTKAAIYLPVGAEPQSPVRQRHTAN